MTTPRKSGLYALIRTDGGPLDPHDCAALGLPEDRSGAGWSAEAVDPSAAARDRWDGDGATALLAGDLWDLTETARAFGLPPGSGPARIVSAAYDRHGASAAQYLRGEWSWLRRNADGSVVVLTSPARRDPVLYAQGKGCIALAPDLFTLTRLDWVSAELDADGLRYALGKGALRRNRGDRTIVRGVHELAPGGVLELNRVGELRVFEPDLPITETPFVGTFADVVELTRSHLLRDMRQRIKRYPATALLLSGGLDSSLLASLIAACGADLSQVQCFSSAAPVGSDLPDETAFAAQVAQHLGLPLVKVAPPEDLNAYRPHDGILTGGNGPPLANRHVLTEAFQQAARHHGCTRMLNGTYGELSVTARLPSAAPAGWRRMAGVLKQHLGRMKRLPASADYHVRFAAHQTSAPLLTVSATQPAPDPLFGFQRGTDKAWSLANEFYPGAVRMDYPFRDTGLLRLIARLPRHLPAGPDGDRALGRALLAGHLPDAIRLRKHGMAASPDHLHRLQRHAPAARQRIAAFRTAGLSEWLDLDWLEQALERMAQSGTRSHSTANEVQLTAIAAEFLLWWQQRR